MLKIVTDPVLISELGKQGIDKDYVEFTQDYAPRSLGKEYSPYAKFYRDLKSGKRFMVVSGLPMVNPEGQKLLPIWVAYRGKNFRQETNLFEAVTNKGEISLTCLCDQSTGIKKLDQVGWRPQLYLNGNEVKPTRDYPSLLDVDPINKNYQYNTLEWDYGVCKRRIRLIEGRLRERWVFYSNPNADVRIKHNFIGKGVKLSGAFDIRGFPLQAVITGDEELIPATEFVNAVFPIEIGASATYYPDASPETSSVDGRTYSSLDNTAWATLRVRDGDAVNDDQAYLDWGGWLCGTVSLYRMIFRGHIVWDTSGLPDTCSISAATASGYGRDKKDDNSDAPTSNFYSDNPASNTAIIAGDHDQVGTTAYCDTPLTYANWSLIAYNDFAFNATGIAAISKTSVTKVGMRNVVYDVGGTVPTFGVNGYGYLQGCAAEEGNGFKPKLVVTYTTFHPWAIVI